MSSEFWWGIGGVVVALGLVWLVSWIRSKPGFLGQAAEAVSSYVPDALAVGLKFAGASDAVRKATAESVQRYVQKHDAVLAAARNPASPGGVLITEEERSRISAKCLAFFLSDVPKELRPIVESFGPERLKGVIGFVLEGLGIAVGKIYGETPAEVVAEAKKVMAAQIEDDVAAKRRAVQEAEAALHRAQEEARSAEGQAKVAGGAGGAAGS